MAGDGPNIFIVSGGSGTSISCLCNMESPLLNTESISPKIRRSLTVTTVAMLEPAWSEKPCIKRPPPFAAVLRSLSASGSQSVPKNQAVSRKLQLLGLVFSSYH